MVDRAVNALDGGRVVARSDPNNLEILFGEGAPPLLTESKPPAGPVQHAASVSRQPAACATSLPPWARPNTNAARLVSPAVME